MPICPWDSPPDRYAAPSNPTGQSTTDEVHWTVMSFSAQCFTSWLNSCHSGPCQDAGIPDALSEYCFSALFSTLQQFASLCCWLPLCTCRSRQEHPAAASAWPSTTRYAASGHGVHCKGGRKELVFPFFVVPSVSHLCAYLTLGAVCTTRLALCLVGTLLGAVLGALQNQWCEGCSLK